MGVWLPVQLIRFKMGGRDGQNLRVSRFASVPPMRFRRIIRSSLGHLTWTVVDASIDRSRRLLLTLRTSATGGFSEISLELIQSTPTPFRLLVSSDLALKTILNQIDHSLFV